MESGNSSSIQSSSGGGGGGGAVGVSAGLEDQEYESNSRNNNYYFNNTTTTQQPPPPYQFHPSMQQFMFQTNNPPPQLPPISQNQNYLDTLNDQSNYQNLMFWQQQPQQQQQQQQPHTTISSTINNPLPPPGSSSKPSTSSGPGKGAATSSGSGQKNPRKRTRASRRAPTTVLTTDTTNFRAMVQEFTGIPSSPFSPAVSPLLSRRLTDIFTGPGSVRPPGLGVGGGGGHLERLIGGFSNTSNNNIYPFRPSAHKPLINNNIINPSTNNPSLLMNINTNDQHINLPFQLGTLSSLSSSSVNTSTMMRYNSQGGLLSGDSGPHFQELSGILGNHNHQEMFLSSTNVNSNMASAGGGNDTFSLPQHMCGGDGGGGSGSSGWQRRPTSIPLSNDDNIGSSDGNNNESNQQMEGTISGSGTTNYDSNLNVIVARDNAPASSNAQGTLGNFLD